MTHAKNTTSRNSALSLGFALSFAMAGGALFGACNTYNPDLGSAPFRCGLDNPRCPDGYECVTYSAAEEICELKGDDTVRADGGPDDADGGGGSFTCNNDSEIEPNESLSDPTLTAIPEAQASVRYVSLAICPSTDQDFFRFEIATNATNVTAEVEYQAGRGALALDILNNTGVSISSAQPVGGNPNILRAAIPNLPVGIYFAQVRSAEDGVQNNYSIEIITE
jgi:hypothetical protein